MTEPNDETVDSLAVEPGWLAERERLRRDRETASWFLLEAEQEIAAMLATPARTERDDEDLQIVTLQIVVTNLRRELDELRASTSWRLTAPLRRVSDLVRRRGT